MALEALFQQDAFRKLTGKEFGIDPNSKYNSKEFAKRAEELLILNSSYAALSKNTGDASAAKTIANVALPYIAGADGAQMLRDPRTALDQGEALLDVGRKKIVKYTERNIDRIAASLPEDKMIGLAVAIPDKDRAYSTYVAAVQSKNAEAIRSLYLELFGKDRKGNPDDLFQRYAATATEDQLYKFAQKEISKMQARLIQKHLSSRMKVVGRGGQEVIKYDSRKAQRYLTKAIEKLKGEQKEAILIRMGTLIAQQPAEDEEGNIIPFQKPGNTIQFQRPAEKRKAA